MGESADNRDFPPTSCQSFQNSRTNEEGPLLSKKTKYLSNPADSSSPPFHVLSLQLPRRPGPPGPRAHPGRRLGPCGGGDRNPRAGESVSFFCCESRFHFLLEDFLSPPPLSLLFLFLSLTLSYKKTTNRPTNNSKHFRSSLRTRRSSRPSSARGRPRRSSRRSPSWRKRWRRSRSVPTARSGPRPPSSTRPRGRCWPGSRS